MRNLLRGMLAAFAVTKHTAPPVQASQPAPVAAERRKGMQVAANTEFSRLAPPEGPLHYVARPVQAPWLPNGVVPSEPPALGANDALGPPMLAADDWGSAPYSPVWGAVGAAGMYFPGYPYLAQLAQRSEYIAPASVRASEMTRKFIELKGTGEKDISDKLNELEAAYKAFQVREVCRTALEHDSLFGRGQIYIRFKGQDSPELKSIPLTVKTGGVRVDTLDGFGCIEPMWTSPYAYNSTDPTAADFYKPRAWYVMGQRVHGSRLLTIITHPVPDMLKAAYNFGGLSMSQLIEPYVNRWLRTVSSVNNLLHNFSVVVLKTDMSTVLSGGAVSNLYNRAQLFTQARDNRGMMLLDKEAEDLAILNVPLSGLSELQAQAQEHMAGPTHIPLVKLFGITPTGLNASSEGEIQVFYDHIHAEQERVLRQPVQTMLEVLQLNLWGEIDPGISFDFVPLREMTEKERAEIRRSDAELAAVLIDKGVISPDEERQRLRDDPDSGYNSLDGDAPELPEPESEGVPGALEA
jgi:phage-related protein (TIGR01555 family)